MTRILLAEDNPVLLKDIAYTLELHGYEVIQVNDEQSVYQVLHAATPIPDVIVSNVGLLTMGKVPLLKYSRNCSEIGIPILFMVAFNSPNLTCISQEMNVGDYIVKPFLIDDFVISIEKKLKQAVCQTGDHVNVGLEPHSD